MKILFLIPYPLKESPSQRFRFEQYFKTLENAGFTIQCQSFLSSNNWQVFFQAGHTFQKALTLIRGTAKRIYALFISLSCAFIFIHREASPVGPPVFEWILAKLLRKKIIYDFDDAIWLTDRVNETTLLKLIKWRSKVKHLCKWSYKISCGNQYLADYAARFNDQVIMNPTTIDCETMHNPALFVKKRKPGSVVIGWTGSHSTLKYLLLLESVLQTLEDQFEHVSFLVIADQPPQLRLHRLEFMKWNPATEMDDLLKIDIGIMPLPDDEWSKGKCGFKALQYMALEIPAVITPVGVNTQLISQGVDGFLCRTNDDWLVALRKLIQDDILRATFGKKGRKKVVDSYSVSSNSSNFLSLFE
jgi:glycosyltransferase involved in cell wall biosynthesis